MGRGCGKQMHMMIVQARQQLSAPCIEHALIWRWLKLGGDSLNGRADAQVNRLGADAGILDQHVLVTCSGQAMA